MGKSYENPRKQIDENAAHHRGIYRGISERIFKRDLDKAFRRIRAICETYGRPTATSITNYGSYQTEVD